MKPVGKLRIIGVGLAAVALSCNLPTTQIVEITKTPPAGSFRFPTPDTPAPFSFLPTQRPTGDPVRSPTPDPLRELQQLRADTIQYTVSANDTLGQIASAFGITVEALAAANDIQDINLLSVGQTVFIPPPTPGDQGPDFKLIPDSELVNGPYNALFNLDQFVQEQGGHLSIYREGVKGVELTGSEIVEIVSRNYSVSPRLLLAVLEHQSGWVTSRQARLDSLAFPIGYQDPNRSGLYKQLSWAADNLNYGFYLWRVNGLGFVRTADGFYIPISPQINAGTAGLQNMFALLLDETAWRETVSEGGFIETYTALFGFPFDWAIEPVVPPEVVQPTWQLPFEPGVSWIFTGGPHGGWGNGSAWAALDFAPPNEERGCTSSDEWVVAMAPGLVIRSDGGIVVQDLESDGVEQIGWTLTYAHIETRDRVTVGTELNPGDRIGHPSCEGGISTGTHVHIARRYNGEWIPIHGSLPFIMDGWVAYDDGILYGGYLQKGDQVIEPCECQDPENRIQK